MNDLERLKEIQVAIDALEERMGRLRWWEWGEKRHLLAQITLLRHRGDLVHRAWVESGGRRDSAG